MPAHASWTIRLAVVLSLASTALACSSAPALETEGQTRSRFTARWQPPESTATGTYEGLNGEGCSGGLLPGTKALGEQLKTQFGTSYGGYSCRANTANTSQLSIHAVGRALDVTASGSDGETIANHLVQNAETLGVDLIIWNHTLWKVTPTGATSREYTGPNPHTDHVHAEVTSATAASGPGQADPSADPAATTDPNADPAATPADPAASSQTDPGQTDPSQSQTDPNQADPGQDYPGPAGPSLPGDYDEMECRTDTDCDPSGQLFCDQGYCVW
jgi:hypothetical protein